jgi:hypothetical protein
MSATQTVRRNKEIVARNKEIVAQLAALGASISKTEISTRMGLGAAALEVFLSCCRHLPWLEIERVKDGLLFKVDAQLRDICELRERHKALDGRSVSECLTELRQEIARRKKENNANREKRNWNIEATVKLELIKLLEWIEDELGKINP